MAEDIRLSVGADTTQMESQIANAARKATVVIRPTIDSKGLEKISAPLGRITGQADEFTKSMEAANARVLAFGASVGVLNAVAKSFQNIVTASTQVEASLKEIQVATGETTGNLERLGKGIFEVARSTGLSFKQASEATLEFARQGGTLEDSLMKAKAALVLTRTTGLDAAEAVKGLTAAVLSFNQVGLDYETVVNKLAAVDTKFAVSSRDLIEGISRSASVAQEAGVSFDELTALITTLQEKTARGGAVIGNALKTIFQRVQTTENLDYIRNLGIAVNDVSGDILPATTIIKKLADEFQNLDSATRKGLLIKIGGGFQIDKLAALLNDISSANGTFNRSLEQSANAGNQGFKKLDELNKTVQASFDRLTTSGTQFAATIGKVAFSDDFRSILNKTSSFLESLNESISGGEEGGATIGKAIVKGIGSIITGPGALLIAGLGIKLFGDLAKFGVDSLKNQLGVTNVKKEQQDIEKSILGLLLQNTAVQTKIVSLEGNKTAQAEYLLGLYSKQAATLEKMSKLSKDIGPSVYEGGIRLTTEGTKNVKAKTAAGGYMSKDVARRMEMREAPAGASIREISNFNFGPKEGRGTMIVNSMESVYKTPIGDFVVPSYSKTRTGKPTLFSASGYVPNFAEKEEEKQKENLLKSLTIDGGAYSFAGLTIGGTGSKNIRSKELNPQLLSKIKDPALASALSKYNKLNFSNVSVGNVYRRRDQNLDSLEAGEEQIKDHFIKKANSALSPQIGSFIKDELDSLGIKPTASMQYAIKSGKKFDFVNESMAGSFFETMLKLANMSASDENFGQFFNDSNSSFDIYGLKPDIAEQYGLPKRFWEYVEIKSSEKALNDELGTKFITQLSQSGGESLKAKFLAQAKANSEEKIKTASRGYVPNFAVESTIKKQQVGDFKNLENAKYADPFDEFKARIKVKRLGKNEEKQDQTIGFFRSESDRIAKRLIGNKKNGYKNSQIKDEYFTEWSKAGVDRSSLSAIESLYQTVDPKNKKDYSDRFKALKFRIQGVIGEIAASKALKKNLTSGNSYFDLPNQTEVRTRAKQSAFDVLRKGVNNWLSNQPKNNIANNGVGKKPKKDEIDLKTINLVLPSDSAFIASEGYVPNFAIKELKNAPLMTFGDRVKTATLEQLKYRLGGDETYTTDLAGTKNNENLDINKIKNDMAASILGPNYPLVGSDGNLDKAYYGRLMSAFANYKTGKTNKTAFGEMPEIKTDENKVVTGEVSGFARELKYEKLGQIFDIIAKNRNMQDVWAQIYQTKASAGVRSINAPSEESKISKLVTQFRPVVIDELTKRLKTKISAIMTTIGRDDAEFLALGKSVDIDQYGNLLAPDKLKVDKLQEERRFVMPLETPDKLKRVGKSKLDRIVLKDPKKRPSEGEDSTFYKTKFNASDVLSIIEKSEYPYGSYEKTKEDKYGRTSTAFITGWKGEYGIENKLNKLAEKNPFLARKIKSNFTYDKIKKKMVVANQAEFGNLKTILETLRDFGVSDWENINFEKSLQTYAPAKTAAKGYVPNFASGDIDGDGSVTRNDPFIKRLMDSAKKFSPIAKELTNNIIGNLLNMPEGIDLFEIIEQLKFVQKAQEPEAELNRIKTEVELKRKFPKKMKRREDFLKRYKGTPPEDPTRTAAKGYIPNFSKQAVLDAIGREQKESGLPLSAIKVVQDARVRGPQNPNGYAVINNRDEPDGRVPNFSDPPKTDPPQIRQDLFNAIEEALGRLENSTKSLDESFTRIATNLGTSAETVVQVLDKITASGNAAAESTQKATESGKKNTDQGEKDAKDKKASKEKEQKTVQDSLYTLLKWQTVIAGVTGALSTFAGDIAKGSEAVGSLVSSFISIREGKGIAAEFLGKNKQGEQASIRDAFKGNIEGKGALAGVGAIIATGGTYIAAGVAAVQALDGAIQILANTSEKSQAAIEELSVLNDKYNAGLTESQKRISANIAEAGKVSGAGIGGFLNRTGISTIFSSEDIKELTKAVSTAQTGRNEQSSEVLVKSFSDRLIPIVEQRMREENPGVEKFSTSAVRENVNFTIAKMLNDIEQQSIERRPMTQREIAQNEGAAISRSSVNYYQSEINKQEKKLKDLKSTDYNFEGKRKSLEEEISKLKEKQNKYQKEYNELTTVTTTNEQKRQELIVKYLKDMERPAQELAYAEATRQEAMLINANLLKAELDASTKLAQLEISRISPRENALSIERELLSTSETRRAAVDLELKQLEEQKRLRAEIKSIAATTGQERVNQYIGFTGSTLTEQRSEEIKGGFQKIITAPAGKENKAIEDFLKILQPIKQDQETLTKEVEKQVTKKRELLETLKQESDLNKDRISETEKEIAAEEAKLQTMNAQNEIGKQLLAIFALQVDVAKKTSAEREKNNAREALNKAIVDQQNNALKMQKDILTTRLDLEQKSLQYNRERLGILRDIADINFERSTLEMPEGPMKEYLTSLQQASSQAQRAVDELNNRKKEKSLTDEKSITSYITGNTNDPEIIQRTLNAKGNIPELKNIALTAIDAQNTSFEDKVINAATEFEKIVTRAGNTVAGNPQANSAEKKTITPESSLSDVLATDFSKTSNVKQLNAAKEVLSKNKADTPYQEQQIFTKNEEINKSLERTNKIKEQYNKLTVDNLNSGAIPELEIIKRITNQYQLLVEKAEQRKRLETGVSGGLEFSMKQINQEIDSFDNKLGRQIPMNFRDGLVDAMKALSDPNATTSLKERLMGVAGAFLNKINEAFMMQAANKITAGIFGNGQPGGGRFGMYASGGPIEGGSGTKDDVPAMLMGGEYVIKKNVVNKYGKDFFDRLNSGKMKGFANGGLATFNGFEAADVKDTVINPTNYIPYGETRMGGLSFDENGRVIGMDSYTGDEQGKQNALMQAQTNFYSQMAQTGKDGFFMPGKYGQGAIIGQQNLLSYASQDTIGTQFDKFSSMGNMAGIDIAGGSANLSLFALRDQGNIRNAEYIESKNKALDLYLGGIGAEKEKYAMDEQNRKEYEQLLQEMEEAKAQAKKQAKKQMQGILIQAGISMAMAGIGSAMSKGWDATNQASGGKASFMQKLGGAFTGGTMTNAAGTSETRGGLFNMFSSSGYKDFSVIGNPAGGLQQWNSGLGQYTSMDPYKFSAMYQPYQDAGRLSYDAFGSPVIGGPLRTGPSSGFNLSNLNPMNWFSRGGAGVSTAQMSNIAGFDYRSLKDGEVSWNERTQTLYDNQGPIKYDMPTRKAAGGTVQGNGMGDNVPAMLNGGEFVMSKQAAQKIGYNNLQQMNSNPQNSGSDITSRIEAKLEELFDKVSGVGTINISVTSDGKGGKKDSEESSNQDQQNKELARKMKEVVLNVLRDEKRLGGLLR
jgi:TP901 family phage tail tape measure protein